MQAESFMNSGSLVPDPLILELILRELTSRNWLSTSTPDTNTISTLSADSGSASSAIEPSKDPSSSFILDGFPRTAKQANSLSRLLPMNLVLHLVTPIDIILSRMATRWVHASSGRVYNIGFNDPKVAGLDNVTGEPLMQRDDDSEQTWRKRLAKFDETSQGLLDFYRQKQPASVVVVKGDGSDEISPQIFQEIERRFA
jgi:adenylate kinase